MHLLVDLYLYTAGAYISRIVSVYHGAGVPYLCAAAADVCLYPGLSSCITETVLTD